MTDPNAPLTPPPAAPAYQAAPPAYGAPAASVPGKTLGIVAVFVAIFFNVIGLILGIVALVQSRKAGVKNGPAVAAIIIGAVLLVVGIIVAVSLFAVAGAALGNLAEICAQNGPGEHIIGGVTYTCPAN
ncbi:DUF4190 domain-containing protein [Microbacterium sp. CJ88]|uniref:DUF4190 domain-containing protein n=1 Tax=Microbacterium sp. CJ88 TaxID=3445672 RepID=UPI003F65CB78